MKKIKQLMILLSLLFITLSLVSCYQAKDIKAPKEGEAVDSVILTTNDGEVVTVTSKTDGILLYNILSEKLNLKNTCYEYSFKDDLDEYGVTINGLYYSNLNNSEGEYNMYFSGKSQTGLTKFDYSCFINKSYTNDLEKYSEVRGEVTKKNNKIIYGVFIENNRYYLFEEKGEQLPTQPPYGNPDVETDEKEYIFYVGVDRARKAIDGIDKDLRGFYIEGYEEVFDYTINITNKYIIFSVEQPYSSSWFDTGYDRLPEKGIYTKTIYYNLETNQIDYMHVYAKTYAYHPYLHRLYEYQLTIKKVGQNKIDSFIEDLDELFEEKIDKN